MDADALVRLLAEPTRLKVFAALVLGARSTGDAATLAGVGARDAVAAVHKLASAGLVEHAGEQVVARTELFTDLARRNAPERVVEDLGYTDERLTAVLGIFVRDGRLLGLPAQHARRRLVLEHLVQSFEPGVDYPEKQVDAVLRDLSDGADIDHVTLRRYLVDEQLLRREAGVYRRSGGPVDVA